MKVYEVTAKFYDYWHTMEWSGYLTIRKLFSTKEKAEQWIAENKTFKFGRNKSDNVATESYEMPEFTIEEVEVN